VLALHGSVSLGRMWRPLAERLGARRVVAPDLHGYGDNAETPVHGAARLDLGLAAAHLRRLPAPVHLVGHSYGGMLALEVAAAMPERLASLTLIEPVSFHVLRAAGDDAWPAIDALSGRHIDLVDAGALDACAEAFMSYWTSPAAWAAMPAPQKTLVAGLMPKVADEWRLVRGVAGAARNFGRLAIPTLLVRGTRTTLAARRVVDRLGALLPECALVEVEGAGHLAPITHPAPVNEAIATHLGRCEAEALLVAAS
jgi:pimeloyl-ACP methyl ester carboxylesterase